MISSIALEAFQAVSRTLNFTKAAASLHITQSALSQRILNLEGELEASLFIRDRAGLKLTETGKELLRYCQLTNQHEEEFLAHLKTQDAKQLAGTLRVAGISSVMRSLFLPAVANMVEKNAGVKLQMSIRETYELPEMLKRGEVDFVINSQAIDRDEMENIRLGIEENILVAKKNYSGSEVYLDHDENDNVTLEYLKKAGRKPKSMKRLYLDDVYGLIDAAKLGLGYAVLPMHLVEQEKSLQVVSPGDVLKISLYLSFYRQPYYTGLHQALRESLEDHFKARLNN